MSVEGSISVATIRQRVAAAILAQLGTDSQGWTESAIPYDQFGTGESENRFDKCFAVGIVSTSFQAGRQQPRTGAVVETVVGVRWACRIAALDQVTTYDEGLAAGENIVRASRTIQGVTAAILVDFSQAVDDQGWMQGELTMRVLHLFSLT